MKDVTLTRRQCLGGLLVAAPIKGLAAQGLPASLTNQAIEFGLAVQDGKMVSRTLVNRLANETVDLPTEDFELEFDGGGVVRSRDFDVEVSEQTESALELSYAGAEVAVRVRYELPAGRAYIRKSVAVRGTVGAARRLMRVDLDNWQGVRREWQSMGAVDRLPFASHPVYCDTMWAGVEFVAAFNSHGHDGFVLRSRPGGKPLGKSWLSMNTTVLGVAKPLRVRDAFLAYIDDIRLAPPRLEVCYNTWWTFYAKELNGDSYLALVRELKEKLHDQHGVFFDIVATDEGWANRQSIWQISKAKMPSGFSDVRAVVEATGGKLGLWISPSAVYPNSSDYEWAANNGYVVSEYDYRRPRRHPGLSLADPKYRRETITQLQRLIRENGLAQIKYDGFIAQESDGHHDLVSGEDSVEPLAHHSFELLDASREANPKVVTEPTYLNSHSNYISPWIIRHADSVWGNSGGDCPRGFTPAPDYREAHTTAREYYIFASMDEVWLPQNAIQYFDIVHADDADFPNHAAMVFGRGRFFVPAYVNPKYMSEDDWRIFAGLLRWARKNRDILRNTHVTLSRVELGEPYVYSHWQGQRGILAVRNPSNETQDFKVDLRRERAPDGLSDAVCWVQYPYRRGIASGLKSDSTIRLKLAPWELLFLEIRERAKLSEPVAVGARWWRGPDGEMLVAGDAGLDKVHLHPPGGSERIVAVSPRADAAVSGEVVSHAVRRTGAQTIGFETECWVTIPAGASRGQALLLLKFPGREHRQNSCRASVNGKAVVSRESSSAGRIGSTAGPDSRWRGVLPYLCEWSWHICELEPGTSRVKFEGTAADPECKVGVWVWSDEDVRRGAVSAGVECPDPQMPGYQERLERRGVCLRRPS